MGGDLGARRAEYLSYLLRLWRVSVEGAPVWRVSLQLPGAAEQTAFAGLDELLAFLRAETGERGTKDRPRKQRRLWARSHHRQTGHSRRTDQLLSRRKGGKT